MYDCQKIVIENQVKVTQIKLTESNQIDNHGIRQVRVTQ